MKLVLGLFPVVAACLAAPGSQGGLLVLPHQDYRTAQQPGQATQQQRNTDRNLDEVSARIMDRLAQEQGSQRGQYHVYLPNGQLQRVQYTTAPISQQGSGAVQFNQQNAKVNVRYLPLQLQEQEVPEQNRFPAEPSQYREESAQREDAFPVNVRYLPLSQEYDRYLEASSGQYRSEGSQVPLELESSSQQQRQEQSSSEYLASIRYSPVEPIQGPVYSYKQEPLVRILRYAPEY